MNKPIIAERFIACLLALYLFQPAINAQSENTTDSVFYVDQWLVSEPKRLFLPAFHDQKNLKGKPFEAKDLLKNEPMTAIDQRIDGETTPMSSWKVMNSAENGTLEFPAGQPGELSLIHQATYLTNARWTKIKVVVESGQCFELYVNGEKKLSNYTFAAAEKAPMKKEKVLHLEPGKHLLLIRSLCRADSAVKWRVSAGLYPAEKGGEMHIRAELSSERFMDIDHLLHGRQLQSVSINPTGQWLMLSYSEVFPPEGHTERWSEVMNIDDGSLVYSSKHASLTQIQWTPVGDELSFMRTVDNLNQLIIYNLLTGQERVIYSEKAEIAGYHWADNGKFILFSRQEEPEKDKTGVKKLEGMPDRWPGYQNRKQLFLIDLSDGSIRRLTHGHVQNDLQDIHPSGKKILITQSVPDYSARPFSIQYLMEMDLEDLSVDTLWAKNFPGVINYSPDGSSLLVRGSPAMFGEMGTNVSKGQIPNDYDTQAYLYDLQSGGVRAITRNFNPSIDQAAWSPADNLIYFLVGDSTYKRIYTYDPETGDFNDIRSVPDVVNSFAVARDKAVLVYSGSSISYPKRCFVYDASKKVHTEFSDPEEAFFQDIRFGRTEEWIYQPGGKKAIDGRIYYPPDFDPGKTWPLIVYYYGGTNPTSRSFRGRYPKNLFAAMGYVVYVLQPSGATGYGQEFSARHVNNWGITVADEIIGATTQFLREHPFVDPGKVGCIGASYGGFMTMLLTTRTDLFSAAISHAGISSISSYWGQGYWGYLYSSTASANSFPWNNHELYVEQSPLFRADKVNTPLLLLTGGADTNVPPGESIQFYTALKLLGKPVELIEIAGENHHIIDYSKRIRWQKTIFAWFDRWLKDQPGWWEDLYPDKDL